MKRDGAIMRKEKSNPTFDFHSSCIGNWLVYMFKVDGRSMFKDCTMFGRFCINNWHSLGKSCIESSCPYPRTSVAASCIRDGTFPAVLNSVMTVGRNDLWFSNCDVPLVEAFHCSASLRPSSLRDWIMLDVFLFSFLAS